MAQRPIGIPVQEPHFTGPKPGGPRSNEAVAQQRLQSEARQPFHPNQVKGPPGLKAVTEVAPDQGRALLRQALMAAALRGAGNK